MGRKTTLSKEHIIDRASELFMKNGFKSTSIADIADACHIQKGALYHYFKSKDDLIQALLDYLLQNVQTKFFPQLQKLTPRDVVAQFENLFDLYTRDQPGALAVMMHFNEFDQLAPTLKVTVSKWLKLVHDELFIYVSMTLNNDSNFENKVATYSLMQMLLGRYGLQRFDELDLSCKGYHMSWHIDSV